MVESYSLPFIIAYNFVAELNDLTSDLFDLLTLKVFPLEKIRVLLDMLCIWKRLTHISGFV